MNMSLEHRETIHSPSCATLCVSGRLNAASALDLKSEIKRMVEGGYAEVIVDLSDVPFVDSSGLAALVSGLKATRQAGGTLKLAGLGEQARTVFRLTMLERVFEIYADAEEALASFSG
jgi:anti-sigma B factor antagonist